MDNNKILCTVDGERIELKAKMRIVLVHPDASNLTPATISRCSVLIDDDYK